MRLEPAGIGTTKQENYNTSRGDRFGAGLPRSFADMIHRSGYALLPRAIRAAIKSSVGLDAVPDDLAPAVSTCRCQLVDRGLKGIEAWRSSPAVTT